MKGKHYWVLIGDVRETLAQIPDASVQCVVTSPPYWGLRDYGHDGQIGLEPTPEEYVANIVEVFREVRRVLRDDGVLWLNLGDSYARDPAKGGSGPNGKHFIPDYGNARKIMSESRGSFDGEVGRGDRAPIRNGSADLKPKDLVGIPWRVAFALQADGWWLRQDNIWHKPNPMPESVKDRTTTAHEYVFQLTKNARYYYDADAIAEPFAGPRHAPGNKVGKDEGGHLRNDFGTERMGETWGRDSGRNARSVWTITTNPYPGAHFATFPPELVEKCIKAGSKPGDTVLDPFAGSGTTGMVSIKLGRYPILCELNPEYAGLIRKRLRTPRNILSVLKETHGE